MPRYWRTAANRAGTRHRHLQFHQTTKTVYS